MPRFRSFEMQFLIKENSKVFTLEFFVYFVWTSGLMCARVPILNRIMKLIIRFNPKRIQFFINHIK